MSWFHIGVVVLLVGLLVVTLTTADVLGSWLLVIGAVVALVGLLLKR